MIFFVKGGVGRAAAVAAAGLMCVACAQAPESIGAAYVSPVVYDHLSCRELEEERARIEAALVTASAQQNQARAGDVAGVLLLGVPVSTFSGANVAPQIASLKGQAEAVHTSLRDKRCA